MWGGDRGEQQQQQQQQQQLPLDKHNILFWNSASNKWLPAMCQIKMMEIHTGTLRQLKTNWGGTAPYFQFWCQCVTATEQTLDFTYLYLCSSVHMNILWCIYPLLGNVSVNKPATNMQPTIQQVFSMWVHIYPLLSNNAVSTFQQIHNRWHPLLGNVCVFCAVVWPEAL
jgi:hypothetical protein